MPSAERGLNLPFTGICTFSKYPLAFDLDKVNADAAILGVPYDQSTQWRSGARMGPRGIREASTLYAFGLGGGYDPERDQVYLDNRWRIVDCGDVDIVHGDQAQSHENVRRAIRTLSNQGVLPVVLGGDHSITAPIIEALDQVGEFVVVQIDAHLDFVDQRSGNRYGHGSPIRRASECRHVKGIAQLGIRGIGSSKRSDFDDARAWGSQILSVRDVRRLGIDRVVAGLPDCDQYYITIDIDGLDPALCPGTGTPSPGGFTYYEVQELLEGIAGRGRIVGFDLVEVAPMYDPTGITCVTAARIVLDLLGFALQTRAQGA